MRTFIRCSSIAAITVLVLFVGSGPASATEPSSGYFQRGYGLTNGSCCAGDEIDGWRADITVHHMSPNLAKNCLISSVSAYNNVTGPDYRQLEAGDVRCGPNANLDGACSQNNERTRFVETDKNGSVMGLITGRMMRASPI